jgi:ABC-type multidrug transport system permease subunit
VDDVLQRKKGRTDPLPVRSEQVQEPGGRYIDFLVPGLIGMSLMGGGLWGVGFATVDMRIRKLLKRFLATPMRKTDFLLGILLSRLIFLVPEILVLLVFARLAFGVVVQGSLLAVVALVLLGALAFAGIGLLVASRAQTLETVSGLMNLVMLPMWVLSGIFFSSERFPEAMQPFIKALPLTALIDALRAVTLEATPLAALWHQVAMLAGWAVVSFVLALRWFRWQ